MGAAAYAEQGERAELTRATLFGPVELLRATYRSHQFAPHAHEEYAIGVIERGAARTRLCGSEVYLAEGTVLLLPPGAVHDGRSASEAGWSYQILYIDPASVRYASTRARLGTDPCALPPLWRTDAALAAAISRVFRLLERAPLATAECERSFVHAFAGCFQRLSAAPAATRSWAAGWSEGSTIDAVRRVREFLDEARGVSVSLVELGRLAGLSPYHLNRTFRATFGLPPYKYYELVRVRRARRLIAAGHPLSQVTYAAGFADQSHLTRHFKRVVGLTPGQYARSMERDQRDGHGSARAASRRVA